MYMGSCDGPPFASLPCLHQGAKKSTVLERLVLRKQKNIWKGVDLHHLPIWDTPRRACISAGAPAHMPLPFRGLWVALFATDCWDSHLGHQDHLQSQCL